MSELALLASARTPLMITITNQTRPRIPPKKTLGRQVKETMATTGPGTTALMPGPQIHQLQRQRLQFFFLVAIVLITAP